MKNRPQKPNPPETAPRDGKLFLGDFGYPWLLMTAWNEHDEKWATTSIQAQEMKGGKTDLWFETEQEKPGELRGWIPLPEIQRKPLTPPDEA
jgi:hypothetical protein